MNSFKEQKQRKVELQIGINKRLCERLHPALDLRFNMKPKRGIEYLKQNGFVATSSAVLLLMFMAVHCCFVEHWPANAGIR